MFRTIAKAWRNTDLRKKLLFTAMVLVVFRLGNAITVPFINVEALKSQLASMGSALFGVFNLMSGGAFSNATLFALGIQPYINASIIVQLLCYAIPALEEIQKEGGERGKRKLKYITYAAAFVIAVIQGIGYYFLIQRYGLLSNNGAGAAVIIIACMVAGACLLTWLGELVEKKGIGNGISLILFVGILSRIPSAISSIISGIQLWYLGRTGAMTVESLTENGMDEASATQYLASGTSPWLILALILGILALLVLIVTVNGAERRIPVQYAVQRQVGARGHRGQSTYIPIKVAMAGVMPIIFAQTILSLPSTIWSFTGTPQEGSFWYILYDTIVSQASVYILAYFLLLIAFSYFYCSIQFDPVEMGRKLQQNGGVVPGYRPGAPTIEVFRVNVRRIVLFGALYLAIVAITPLLAGKAITNLPIAIGGTSVIIVVSVALETKQALESELTLHSYSGFLA